MTRGGKVQRESALHRRRHYFWTGPAKLDGHAWCGNQNQRSSAAELHGEVQRWREVISDQLRPKRVSAGGYPSLQAQSLHLLIQCLQGTLVSLAFCFSTFSCTTIHYPDNAHRVRLCQTTEAIEATWKLLVLLCLAS